MTRAAVLALASIFWLAACGRHDAKPDAAIAPRPADPVAIGDPVESPTWSPDGRHVAFHIAPHEFAKWERAEVWIVVDARTHATFTVDRVVQLAFAPDGAHLGVVANDAVVVYDLATRRALGAPSPIAGPFTWDDTAIAWMSPDEVVHRRDVATGREVAYRGLPPAEGATFVIDEAERVIASNRAAIRAWAPDQSVLVSIDDRVSEVATFPEGVAYTREDAGERRFFAFVELRAGARPVEWPARGPCKRAEMDRYSSFSRCSAARFLTRGTRSYCVWDVATGELASHFGPVRDEYGCVDDLVYTGDTPPGGPYTFFDAKTGRGRRGPAHFYPGERGADDSSGTPQFCPGGAGSCILAPSKDRIAGAVASRATLWSTAGAIEWQAPAPPVVAAVAFAPNSLVVAGHHGELWRVELASRALTRSAIPDCVLDDQEPIAVMRDGAVAAPCQLGHGNGRALVLEGGGQLAHLADYGWYATAATSATDGTVGWLSNDGAHAFVVPGGHERWVHDVDHYGFALTADGSRFAATQVVGDPARPNSYDVSVRDAHAAPIATVRFAQAPKSLALSPTGAWLAVISDSEIAIVDVAHAQVVDHLPARHTPPVLHDVVAWAPDGTPRVAYWRATPAALVIRDVAAQRDLETRLPSRAIDGTVRDIAWAAAGIAVVADERVTLWEGDRASSQLGFAEAAGVEVGAEGRAQALGGPNAARSLFATP